MVKSDKFSRDNWVNLAQWRNIQLSLPAQVIGIHLKKTTLPRSVAPCLKGRNQTVSFKPINGQQVLVKGAISV